MDRSQRKKNEEGEKTTLVIKRIKIITFVLKLANIISSKKGMLLIHQRMIKKEEKSL